MSVSFLACQKAIARIKNLGQQVEGAGFLISSRYLLTCAHVVINALEIEQAHISDIPQQELSIDFPSSLEKVSRRGKVIVWQPCPTLFDTNLEQAIFGEDIALLELNEAIPSLQIKSIDLVSVPLEIFDQEQPKFSTYGFPSGSDNGKKTEGIIFGVQATRWLQLQGTDNRPLILGGYSGSPLFAETTQGTGIVGMTVASEYHYSDKQEKYLGGKEAYAIPALALAEVWFKQGLLIECLSSCDQKWIEKAYNHCRQKEWTTIQPQKIEEFVKDLYQYSDSKKNYLLEFVVYLITQANFSEELKAQLRQWAERAYQLTEVELGQECDRFKEAWKLEQTAENTDIDSRLWIILNKAGTKDQYTIESAYYIKDINNYQRDNPESYQEIELESPIKVTRSQLQDRNFIFPDLQTIIDQTPCHPSLRIEFCLPFDSLDLMPDNWLIKDEYDSEPYPLGRQYPVVLRVLERLGYKNKTYKYDPLWKKKWQPQYLNELSQQGLICCELPSDEISRQLRNQEVLGLHCISPIETHKKKPKLLIMQKGLSIALWFRQELKNCCGTEIYQRLLETKLTELLTELCDTRQAEPDNERHLARHISLLWDNPIKIPFDAPTLSDRNI